MSAKFIPPPGYGEPNFRPARSERERAKRNRKSAQERREGNCDIHRAYIKTLPCAVCLKKPPSDGHHLKIGEASEYRGIGMRAVDRFLVPLCRFHHDDLESYGSRREYEWWAAYQIIDPVGMANALWDSPKTQETGIKIIHAHRTTEPKI